MRVVGRCVKLLAVAATLTSLAGCGFGKRPYARDPLLRDGGGLWGNAEIARGPDYTYFREPLAPHAPKPTTLPTMEWETARGGK